MYFQHLDANTHNIVCGFKNLFVLLEEENWKFISVNQQVGEVGGGGGARHEMLLSCDL